MSTVQRFEEPAVTLSGSDPAGLPLFGTPPAPPGPSQQGRRPGRTRGSFTLGDHAVDQADVIPMPPQPERPETAGWHRGEQLDWAMVASLRQQTADRLSQESAEELLEDRDAQRERGRTIIWDLISQEGTERARAGAEPWSTTEQGRIARAVFDAVFGLGRLQPLVDDDQVENVMIFGHDRVVLELTGGRLVDAAPVADSDQELIEFLSFVATRSEVNARPFSPSHPRLHLRLDGGARLAAQAWVTPRPQVVIRRHRLTQISLEDLVGLEAMSPVAASFLAAVVRSGRSIVVSGAQGAGKTTVVRALCNEIPPYETIGTFETEYELHLHEMPDRHPHCFAWEARPGSGEVGPDGRKAGEFTLDEALFDSFRMNLSRQIVGEVRGPEAMAMLKAMQSGAGSISTTHAANAVGAIEKLVTCVMESGTHATHDFALRSVAAGINVIVHVTKQVDLLPDGAATVTRFVSEIITLTPGEAEKGYAVTHVFRTEPAGRRALPAVLPDEYRDLVRFGFDLAAFHAGQVEGSGA